jgi:predicted dehydrogenase
MQIFGSKGWVEVGDVEHLHTWDMKVCFFDPADPHRKQRPELRHFAKTSTERAELEHFAQAAAAGKPLALPAGDDVHNVAVLEAIVRSSRDGTRTAVA